MLRTMQQVLGFWICQSACAELGGFSNSGLKTWLCQQESWFFNFICLFLLVIERLIIETSIENRLNLSPPVSFFFFFNLHKQTICLPVVLFWKQYNLQQYNTIEETTENAVLLWHPHWVHWPGSDMLYMYTLLINLKKGSCFHFAYRQLLKF